MSQRLCESEGLGRSSARRIAFWAYFIVCCMPVAAGAAAIYDSIPNPLPGNVPSLGYQSAQTAEFGDLIQFAGAGRTLSQVTIVMSDWALAADYPSFPGAGGPTWNHPLTLNLYNVDNSGPNPAPGTLLATRTQTAAIPWRPVADPSCSDKTQFRAPDGLCYSGLAFTVTFDFTGVTVPDQIIYGVAYDTETYGANPIGTAGPYISLNFGLAQVPPATGSNPFPDTAYWNTQASNYTASCPGGTFCRDTAWTPYSGAIRFDSQAVAQVPTLSHPGLLLLVLCLALLALSRLRRGRRAPS
jgi:IPTL-CTERM motif